MDSTSFINPQALSSALTVLMNYSLGPSGFNNKLNVWVVDNLVPLGMLFSIY